MKVLITAFEPFGGDTLNSAQEAVKGLPDRVGTAKIAKRMLPVSFGRTETLLKEYIEAECPDAVLCIGQAGGRAAITIERVAINVDDASIPDNDGHTPEDQPIHPNSPAAYFATIPVKRLIAAIRKEGIPAEVSNSAGTYVCNHVMYCLLDILEKNNPRCRGGFIHVPCSPEQVLEKSGKIPSMSIADVTKGLLAAIRELENG